MKNYYVLLLVIFTVFNVGVRDSMAQEAETARIRGLLDAFERVVLSDNLMGGEAAIGASYEYKAALNEGLVVVPEIITRISASQNPRLIRKYLWLFIYITQISAYTYTTTNYIYDGINYYEVDLKSLPFLAYEKHTVCYYDNNVEKILSWWKKISETHSFGERTDKMRGLIENIDEAGTNLSAEVYRAYCREFINYGVFNLPSYITLINECSNPLAFAEFLCVSNHTAYRTLPLQSNRLENVKTIAKEWPSHAERMDIVKQWWAERSYQFKTFPYLERAIAEAIGKGVGKGETN